MKPLLTTWQDYFSEDLSEDRKMFHHRGVFHRWASPFEQLERFAKKDAGHAIVLSGAGGQGKSRLLLELAKHLEKQENAPRVRFLQFSSKELSEEQLDLIGRQQNLLLIVEDAHRIGDEIATIARATGKSKTIRLLLATRPQARDFVISELSRSGYLEKTSTPIDLPKWKEKDILALAENLLNPTHQLHAPHLAQMADRCPLLVVIGAALINAGTRLENITDQSLFREKVFKGFLDDFLQRIDGHRRRDRLRQLITVLSFISPSKNDNSLIEKTSAILACTTLDIVDDLALLEESGLLAKNQEGIRIYPDLFADAILLEACTAAAKNSFSFVSIVLNHLSGKEFPSLIRNLAQADWETRSQRGAESSFFDPIWKEYSQRFKDGDWWDRENMLRQWVPFAAFQPEHTLELARLAVHAQNPPIQKPFEDDFRKQMLDAIPALLKPIIQCHRSFSSQALDILSSLPISRPRHNDADTSPFGTIASAANFSVRGHYGPENVLSWFEKAKNSSPLFQILLEHSWIIPTILEPYFDRVIEDSWISGNTMTFRAFPVHTDRTRPLRTKALKLADEFIASKHRQIANAGITVLEIATRRIESKFGFTPSEVNYQAWQGDRLLALTSTEAAIYSNSLDYVAQLRIRTFLLKRSKHDPDNLIKQRSRELLSKIVNSFELRVARVLTSWIDDEVSLRPSADFEAAHSEAQTKWNLFCAETARETLNLIKSPKEFVALLVEQTEALKAVELNVQPIGLIRDVCKIAPEWSVPLLESIWSIEHPVLVRCLSPVFQTASAYAPEAYERHLTERLATGRCDQVCSLIDYLGFKSNSGNHLSMVEKLALKSCASRTESEIVRELASAIAFSLKREPEFSLELLLMTTAADYAGCLQILRALKYAIKANNETVTFKIVESCLRKVGAYCLPESKHDENYLEDIAETYPKEVYHHLLHLIDNPLERSPSGDFRFSAANFPTLGTFPDSVYVRGQVGEQWSKIIHSQDDSRWLRIELLRSLIWSDKLCVQQYALELVKACKSVNELDLAIELFASSGSSFVFEFPAVVKELLITGSNLGSLSETQRELVRSGCGGVRGFSGGKTTEPHVENEARRLAEEFVNDELLKAFYDGIIAYEVAQEAWNRKTYTSEDEDSE